MAEQNEAEFEQLVRESHIRIRAYIAGMGIPSHEVDDVAQDVYVEYFRNLEKRPQEAAPERWLKGIARNLCLNRIRRSARRARLHHEAISEMLAEANSMSDRLVSSRAIENALEGCLGKLAPEQSRLLQLKYKDELTSKSIADVLESTAEAVRIALFRLRASLRDCVDSTLARENG